MIVAQYYGTPKAFTTHDRRDLVQVGQCTTVDTLHGTLRAAIEMKEQTNKDFLAELNERTSTEDACLVQPYTGKPASSPSPYEIEDQIAGIILNALQKKDSHALEQSWSAVERGCFRLVQTGRRFNATISYRPLLDGLLRLVHVHPSMSSRLYSCVVLLSSYSVRIWTAFVRTSILDSHTEIQDVIAKTAARMNPTWDHWNIEDQKLVANSLMDLSNIDNYDGKQLLWTLPVTPISIAISRCVARASNTTTGDDPQMPTRLLNNIVSRCPSWAWESIPTEDLIHVIGLLPESTNPGEEMKKRTLLMPAQSLCMGSVIEVSSFSDSTSEAVTAQAQPFRVLLETVRAGTDTSSPESIVSPSEAYSFVKRQEQTNNETAIHSATDTWLRQNKPDLVAAAYVAAPKPLRLIVDRHAEVHFYIQSIPIELVSGLDLQIDEHLAGLLGFVQDIADVYGVNRNFSHRHHFQFLKRVAVLHPWLMLRRVDSVCAAGRTILEGLSTPSQVLDDAAIKVLEYLLDITSGLPFRNSRRKRDASDFMIKTISFLADDVRLPDGIPEQLEALTRTVFKAMESCIEEDVKPRVLAILQRLANINRSNEILLSDLRNLASTMSPLSTDMRKSKSS